MDKRNTVLIVDDTAMIRMMLRNLLSKSYRLLEAENGARALEVVHQHPEIDIILMDIMMPQVDGFQVMAQLKRENLLQSIPIVLITSENSEKYIRLGYDLGASDVIHKPFNPLVIERRVDNLVSLYQHKNHLERMVQEQTNKLLEQTERLTQQQKRLSEINTLVIDTLSTVIEYRSLESGQHIKRIRAFTRILLEALADHHYSLTQQEITDITSASAMHDIGKIAIPDSVLLKPGRLTPEEFEIMKTHTTRGCEILQHLSSIENKEYLHYCYDICLSHHERWNGGGYPDGLRGDDIPLCAQVVSVADVYDALTNQRVYKPAYTHEEALRMIIAGECGKFSPTMLECLIEVVPKFKELSDSLAAAV